MKVIVSENEVGWVFGKINPGPQAMSAIRQYLGTFADNFLPINVGMRVFSWELPNDGWERFSQAPSYEAGIVKDAYYRFCADVMDVAKSKAGDNAMYFVNNVLTVPNNDYIFYKLEPDGNVKFLITAWGFRNLVRPNGGPIRNEIQKNKERQVKCGFSVDGELQPHRAFTSCFGHQLIPTMFETGEDGFYSFSQGVNEGEKISIVDVDTKRCFELVVQGDQCEYVFDVTQKCDVRVYVAKDGYAQGGVYVQLDYNGVSLNAATAEDGVAVFNVAYLKDKYIEASVDGETLQKELELGDNLLSFNLTTPIKKTLVKILVKVDGVPFGGEGVKVGYGGNQLYLNTDYDGMAVCEIESNGVYDVAATVRDSVQVKVIDGDELFFDFDFVTPVVRVVTVRVEDEAGNPFAGRDVSLKQDDYKVYGTLDENGTFSFEDTCFRRDDNVILAMSDGNGESVEISFVLEEDEDEYILQETAQKERSYLFLGIFLLLTATAVSAYFLAPYFLDLVKDAGKALS